MSEKITVKTKHGDLSLEQLAEVQPGMARLMKEIGDRFHVLYYAAKGGNWRLAQHELNVAISILKTAATLRPKYSPDIANFTETSLHPIGVCIKSKDWSKFEERYTKSVEEANKLHEKYDYGFIRYVVPKELPEQLDLTSRE